MVIRHVSTTREYNVHDVLGERHFLNTNVCINGNEIDIVARQEAELETIRHTFVNMTECELEGLIKQLTTALAIYKDPNEARIKCSQENLDSLRSAVEKIGRQ